MPGEPTTTAPRPPLPSLVSYCCAEAKLVQFLRITFFHQRHKFDTFSYLHGWLLRCKLIGAADSTDAGQDHEKRFYSNSLF